MHPISLMTLALSLVFSLKSHATQRVFIQEGLSTRALISREHLNHIALENDRISSVKALQGQFELDKDTERGQIFIKPLAGAQNPLALFLSTQEGKTYILELSLEAQRAQSIILVPPPLTEPLESDYLRLLQGVLSEIHRGHSPRGFVRTSLKHPIRLSEHLKGHVVQVYQGPLFKVEILALQNLSPSPLTLTELDVYQEGMKAISIVDKVLLPKAWTQVYWVRT